MTDPYRYLPCALHEALEIPWDVPWCRWRPDGPKEQIGPQSFVQVVVSDIDLSHPSGWDHAVRALAAIKGIGVPESSSVAFLTGEFDSQVVGGWSGGVLVGVRQDRPQDRREALCRCICAALGVEVGEVFP